jgi:hypothetical protein
VRSRANPIGCRKATYHTPHRSGVLFKDLPVEAAARTVEGDDKRVAPIGWLGFPVGDHSELNTVDLDILKDWETVIDRRTRRTSHERREDSVWRGLWSGVG